MLHRERELGLLSCWEPGPRRVEPRGWSQRVVRLAGRERCGSATKTVARDAGASSPHQVILAHPGARLAGRCWGGGGVSVGFRGVVPRSLADLGSCLKETLCRRRG